MIKDNIKFAFVFIVFSIVGIIMFAISVNEKPKTTKIDFLFKDNEPIFLDSVVEKDGYTYILGSIDNKIKIAKVKTIDKYDRKKYLFLKCNGSWIDDISDACGYFNDVGDDICFFWNATSKEFRIYYKKINTNETKRIIFNDFKSIK